MSPVQHEANPWGQITDGHLGGYVPGGDPNTQYPILWNWLVNELGVRSVLDVGCGDGKGSLTAFGNLGCSVTGIEGTPQEDERIILNDYAGPGWIQSVPYILDPEFNLVWSCEFVEHVEEQFVPRFLTTFSRGELVLMTHATPGQGGHHHVNEQEAPYWIGVMAGIGYQCDLELTLRCREFAGEENIHPNMNYFQKTGLAFRRKP